MTPPDNFSYLDACIRAVRARKVHGMTKQDIASDLSRHFGQEIIFLAWAAAAILTAD